MSELDHSKSLEVTRVIAIRHGRTAWNAGGRIQGQLDIPLDDLGRWQAGRLAQALEDESVSAIYASDLQRAHETAKLLAQGLKLSVGRDAGLRERGFGIFEGMTFEEVEERWPEESTRWRKRDPEFSPHGGETLQQFFSRSLDTASRLAAGHPGETIVLVAHGGVLDCLYRAATRLSLQAPRTWEMSNAGINRLLYTSAGFMLVGWSDTLHLDLAEYQ